MLFCFVAALDKANMHQTVCFLNIAIKSDVGKVDLKLDGAGMCVFLTFSDNILLRSFEDRSLSHPIKSFGGAG